jgi:hypothetical protein
MTDFQGIGAADHRSRQGDFPGSPSPEPYQGRNTGGGKMIDYTPDFPPFTKRQSDLIEELKAEIEKRNALSALDPEMPKINMRIDDLSIKVGRFALKNIPKESRRPGKILIDVATYGGRLLPGEHILEMKPGFGIFHPDLLPWAKNHLIEWIRQHRAGIWRYDGREVLRETGIVGIETGMPGLPIDIEDIRRWALIKRRVLELRGVKGEESQDDHVEENENDDLQHWLQDSNRMKGTPVMLKKPRTKMGRKRTRKPSATWDMVIDKLVEEKMLPKKMTRQAFKKQWEKHVPDIPWNTI